MKMTVKQAELTARALWREMCRDARDNVGQYAEIIYNIENEYGLEEWNVLRDTKGNLLYAIQYDIIELFNMKDKFEADGIRCEWIKEFYANENCMNQ